MSAASSASASAPVLGRAAQMMVEFADPGEAGMKRSCVLQVHNCLSDGLQEQHGPVLFLLASLGNLPSGGVTPKFDAKVLERHLPRTEHETHRKHLYTHTVSNGGNGNRYISIAGVQHLLDNSKKLEYEALGYAVSLAF